jgi:hypothetical protein
VPLCVFRAPLQAARIQIDDTTVTIYYPGSSEVNPVQARIISGPKVFFLSHF